MTPTDNSRRRLLGGMLAAAPLAAALGSASAPVQARVKTQAHIVIAGCGAAGVSMANRMSRALDGAKITIIDGREEHYYQPGWTLVASGIWPMRQVLLGSNAELLSREVEWVRDYVAEFDPVANAVVTQKGQRIGYDFLIVATGLHLGYEEIEGMDVAAIGQNGLTSVYASPQAAAATWASMDAFRQKGGRAVAMQPHTPMKCAGAPLKMTLLLADRLGEAGTLAQSDITYFAGGSGIFGVKEIQDFLMQRFGELGVGVELQQRLSGIDIGARRATFSTPDGQQSKVVDYDFIHVVPPMRAPDAVRDSELSWKEGPFASGGWLEVHEGNLRHRRFPNVFGVGDINGTRRGKTSATVKAGAGVVGTNLVDVISGREPSINDFNGYTSCPLIVRQGAALLLEFEYTGGLVSTLPFVDPMEESFFAWVVKTRLIKPAYMAMLQGRV